MIYAPHRTLLHEQIKEDEMTSVCGLYERDV